MTEAYPLQWPESQPRTKASQRKRGQFGTTKRSDRGWSHKDQLTVAEAVKRLQGDLAA